MMFAEITKSVRDHFDLIQFGACYRYETISYIRLKQSFKKKLHHFIF